MGADQSSGGATAPPLKSQRDEDIPYTSCAIGKPISSDIPARSSPLLKTKSTSRDSRGGAVGKHDIVVVTEGQSTVPQIDTELLRLEVIPTFFPLLRGGSGLSGGATIGRPEWEGLSQLDARHVLGLCLRYQEHLKQCAETVSSEQNAITARIKEVDFLIQSLYGSLTERQKRFSKYAEQIQKVQEMSNVLSRIQSTFEQTIPLMERLNSVLPPEEQLEPFSLKTSK